MKISTARGLTASSPVTSIQNLVAWYDSVSDASFDDSEEGDSLSIANWYDLNPQSSLKNNMASSTSKAVYNAKAINGLPALYFNGSDYNGYSSANLVIDTEMTIFAVATNESSSGFRRLVQSGTDAYFSLELLLAQIGNSLLFMVTVVPGIIRVVLALMLLWVQNRPMFCLRLKLELELILDMLMELAWAAQLCLRMLRQNRPG